MVVTPAGFLVTATPSPSVLIPAINVDMPVIVATFTIFGVIHFLQYLFCLFINQTPWTKQLPFLVMSYYSVRLQFSRPSTNININRRIRSQNTNSTDTTADDALILPVTLPVTLPATSPVISPVTSPRNVVAVTTPVTLTPVAVATPVTT